MIIVVICAALCVGLFFARVTLQACSRLHNQIFRGIIASSMHFFETIPIGRIQNLFSRDIDEVDNNLPLSLDGFLQRFMLILCILFTVALIFPWFLLALLVFAIFFTLIYQMFRGAMRDLKRFENTSRSPKFSHVSASAHGILTIRAFMKQSEFIKKFTDLVDSHSAANFLYFCAMRWLSTRMDILCIFLTTLVAVFALIFKRDVGAAFSALAVSLSLQVIHHFPIFRNAQIFQYLMPFNLSSSVA